MKADMDTTYFVETAPEISAPLTLDEIITLAVERNLDIYVKAQEYTVQKDITFRQAMQMLPDFTLEEDISYRNNSTASTSQNITPPNSPLAPFSISSPQRTFNQSADFVWNLMDTAVAYFRTREEAWRETEVFMDYARAKQNLILNVTRSYWRAVSAKFAVDTAIPLVEELRFHRQHLISSIDEEYIFSIQEAYERLFRLYQREIQLQGFNDRTDSSDPTQGYQKEYENAMNDLASFMRFPPGMPFEIHMEKDLFKKAQFESIEELEVLALTSRPELYSNDAEMHLRQNAVWAALIQQFPVLDIFRRVDYQKNMFLLHQSWITVGGNLIWNLANFPRFRAEAQTEVARRELTRRNRLVLDMSIMVQLRLAKILYDQNYEQFLLARKATETNEHLANIIEKQNLYGKKSRIDALNARIDAVLAKVNAVKVYAEMQNSLALINNTLGLPFHIKATEIIP